MKPYACHNRKPFAQACEVQNGWTPEFARESDGLIGGGTFMRRVPVERAMVKVPFRMAPDCQYTHTELGNADARCAGCKHRAEAAA